MRENFEVSSKQEKKIEIPSGRKEFFDYLLAQQELQDAFPHSKGGDNPYCKMNPEQSLKEYQEELPDYVFVDRENPEKCDFGTKDSPNSGYKIHLNVAKEDVRAVAEYLKNAGFVHKYLSGGEPSDGKVFTIYGGSKEMVQKISGDISNFLGDKLCRPVNVDEVEFAPNIVGRFDMQDSYYHRLGLGIRGLSMRMEDVRGVVRQRGGSPQEQKQRLMTAFRKSYNDLADRFGSYFYG